MPLSKTIRLIERVKNSNILFWVPLPPPYSGPEIASSMLLEELEKKRLSVFAVNSTVRKNNLDKGVVDIRGIPLFFKILSRFFNALIRNKCSVVFMPLSANRLGFLRDMVLMVIAKSFGIKIVTQYWGGNYRNYHDSCHAIFRFLIKKTWNLASQAIVETEMLKSLLAPLTKTTEYRVISNGLPPSEYPAREKYSFGLDVSILYIGHLSYTKGFHDFIQAYKILAAKYPGVRLLFAGEKPNYSTQISAFLTGEKKQFFMANYGRIADEILDFIDKAASYRAEYTGIVSGDKKRMLFAKSDIFVQPSYMEGMSLALLEAMFTGLPVVATAVGAAPEIIVEGENGYLIEPGDTAKMVNAIEGLICAPKTRMIMGRKNAAKAREKYTIEMSAEKYHQIFLEVATD
jgi:glycosyltransferase involved in cell wall biosynthesis